MIEGFYGRPWTTDERTDAIRFLPEVGMNAYVHAPKDDPYHRAQWRTPYPEAERAGLEAVARTADDCGVEAGFAISPGLDLRAADGGDLAALSGKVADAAALGFPWIVLAFDDIPRTDTSAAAQAQVVQAVLAALPASVHSVTVVPTEYIGTVASPYLAELSAALDPAVSIMWTGPTVCSPTISAAEAAAWVAAVDGRSTVLWDNTPVNDGTMAASLHLGPYRGREPELTDHLDGILLNPMNQAVLSRIAIAAAAEYCAAPNGYDAQVAWVRAVERVDAGRGVLGPIAAALAAGPLVPVEDLPIAATVDAVASGADGGIEALRAELRELRRAVTEVRRLADEQDALAVEVLPWCDAIDREVGCGLAAVRLLELLERGTDDDLLAAAFGAAWSWSAARADGRQRVFGGRAGLLPSILRLDDGTTVLDPSRALRFGPSPIDHLGRCVLDRYADRYGLDRLEVSG